MAVVAYPRSGLGEPQLCRADPIAVAEPMISVTIQTNTHGGGGGLAVLANSQIPPAEGTARTTT